MLVPNDLSLQLLFAQPRFVVHVRLGDREQILELAEILRHHH